MKKEKPKKNITQDLQKELDEKKLALRDIRFGIAGSKSKDVKRQKNLKKEIARILTKINNE
ncbi:MAG: 50S ribosomal protein L29 [Candidatus Zambryskibacteria bacterium]|nr:50S ribosomal protein L29 [Candidatus Zambryskibacteria bacterium]